MSVRVAEIAFPCNMPIAKEISLRVGGVYTNLAHEKVKIVAFDKDRSYMCPYIGDNDVCYGMNGLRENNEDGYYNLTDTVNLDDVQYVTPEVGKSYRTERNDYVTIYRTFDAVDGFPFQSDVGDLYSDRGERFRATPGSHLVIQEDRPVFRREKIVR